MPGTTKLTEVPGRKARPEGQATRQTRYLAKSSGLTPWGGRIQMNSDVRPFSAAQTTTAIDAAALWTPAPGRPHAPGRLQSQSAAGSTRRPYSIGQTDQQKKER